MTMIEIHRNLLKLPTPDVREDDEYMHFAKSFAKRQKKLPQRA